jgi:Histidine kinase
MKMKIPGSLIHIGAVIAFLSFPVLFSPDADKGFDVFAVRPFQRDFVAYVLMVGFFYLHYFYLLPHYYFKRKYLIYTSFLISSFLLVVFMPGWIISDNDMMHHAIDPNKFNPENEHRHNSFLFFIASARFFQFASIGVFSMLLKMHNRLKDTRREQLGSELSFLKAQINPHFLFNTLNSIYSSAVQENASNTANSIVRLSGLMRYVYTESDSDFVPLEHEINYITDYVLLQESRLQDTVPILFQVEGDFDNKKIAPLLLMPFIENAFKYGVNAEESSRIFINISVTRDQLILTAENNKVSTIYESSFSSGVGLSNVRNRLQLVYPNRHELIVKDLNDVYKVYLSIQLR